MCNPFHAKAENRQSDDRPAKEKTDRKTSVSNLPDHSKRKRAFNVLFIVIVRRKSKHYGNGATNWVNKLKDENTFYNRSLGFSITKPSDWIFLPSRWAWALKTRQKYELKEDDIKQLMENANSPFVYFHYDHQSEDYVFPTVQACCRPIIKPGQKSRKNLIDAMVSHVHQMDQQARIEEINENAILSGHSGIRIRCIFSLFAKQDDGKPKKLKCVNKSYIIFAHQLAYTIGFSHPSEGPYQNLEDLLEIERSIRIEG